MEKIFAVDKKEFPGYKTYRLRVIGSGGDKDWLYLDALSSENAIGLASTHLGKVSGDSEVAKAAFANKDWWEVEEL